MPTSRDTLTSCSRAPRTTLSAGCRQTKLIESAIWRIVVKMTGSRYGKFAIDTLDKNDYRPSVDEKFCFVLLPLKEPFLGYYQEIIKPVAKEAGLETLHAGEIYGTNAIIRDVWESIWRARLIVADVSGKNPNVNYELGLCHALGVPTI